jgi:3-isopropylmalate/(R)-2-methylmalate dehydratase small subunit
VTVDLFKCQITSPAGRTIGFQVDPARRDALLRGLDAIGTTLEDASAIDAFQKADAPLRPWVYHPGAES